MNVELLRKIAEVILEKPQLYNQSTWAKEFDKCGTTCCIAGWADCLSVPPEEFQKHITESEEVFWGEFADSTFFELGRRHLDLTPEQADRLFSPADDWPEPFSTAYYDADESGRAIVAANRIEHFIDTEGCE